MALKTKKHRILSLLMALAVLSACNTKKSEEEKIQKEQLKKLKEESLKILPESFQNIWLGIEEDRFVKARSNAKFNPAKNDPGERKWYAEVDQTGVQVMYGIGRETKRLVVIQFLSKLPSWKIFSEHAALLMEKYGTDYELYVCPAADPRYKMTRLLWPKQPVSIMEAILEGENQISVTMVVSGLKDARKGIERQKCPRIDKEAYLENWIQENLDKETRPPGKGGCGDHDHE